MNSTDSRLAPEDTLSLAALIAKLEEFKLNHGDLPIVIGRVGMGSPIKNVIFVEQGSSAVPHHGTLPLEPMPARLAIV